MTKPDILVYGALSPEMARSLEKQCVIHGPLTQRHEINALEALLPRIRAIASIPTARTDAIDAALIDTFAGLELISSFGVGYDHIDAVHAAARNIVVTHTPDVLTDEVADLAVGLLVMTARNLGAAERWLRAGCWTPDETFALSASLRERRIGIIGLGRIGKAIARRLDAFGLRIAYHGRRAQLDQPYAYFQSAADLALATDVLIVAAPGGTQTHHLVDATVLAALGSKGIVINIGRGSVIDEAALVRALQTGTIAAAGLDVFEDEPHVPAALLALDNVVLLPHVGSASRRTRDAMGQLVVDNINAWAGGGKPLTPVPECSAL